MIRRQNYLKLKEIRKQKKLDAGLISESFPKVSNMVIRIEYYRKLSDPVLMVRTINFFPTSYAYFHIECVMKDCVDGGFDLTSVIVNLAKKHIKTSKGKMVCKGRNDSINSDHISITYEINIKYSKKSK